MNILITGGTGTLGKQLVLQLLQRQDVRRIVVYSRDEYKQHVMMSMPEYDPMQHDDRIRYFVGDVRDENRLIEALDKCDTVIHTAALKQVPSCEYNPQEAIKTNVLGTMSVLSACKRRGIRRCIVVSTDKAVQPVNLYGATKLCAEKLAVAYNIGNQCKISVVRYGNVLGSRGSVLEVWRKQRDAGEPITITAPQMTRFWIRIEDAAAFILRCINLMSGGEVFIPKMPACSMEQLARMVAGDGDVKAIAVRPGEKMHEALVSNVDALNTTECEDCYIIYPQHHEWTRELEKIGVPVIDEAFEYNSKTESLKSTKDIACLLK